MSNLVLVTEQKVNPYGTICYFWDRTGETAPNAYGMNGNISMSAVSGVRIKIGTATTIQNPTTLTSGETFLQFHEYQKTAGSSQVIDGKTCVVGTVLVPQITGLTVPSGDTWETTGYYVPQILTSWTPTPSQVPLSLTINELGQSGSTVQDNCYIFAYDIFIGPFTTPTTAVVNDTYLVTVATCTYEGNTYRAGEIFTATVGSTITPVGTGATVSVLEATTASYAILVYNLETAALLNIESKGNTGDLNYWADIYGIQQQIQALQFGAATLNIDFTVVNDLITSLTNQVVYLDFNNA